MLSYVYRRLWWGLLPYAGAAEYPNPDNPPTFRDHVGDVLWQLVDWLPGNPWPKPRGRAC